MSERQESGKSPRLVTDEARKAGLDALHADPEWHRPDSGGGTWRANYQRAVDLVLDAAEPHLVPRVDRDALETVLALHRIECTGPGEVTCRDCRDKGWMSWPAYRSHVADLILALLAPSHRDV